MREKIEFKEYTDEEFNNLTTEATEKTKYEDVYNALFEKLKGKNLNSVYLKSEFVKECNKQNIAIPKYIDSILYGKMQRMEKNKKAKKHYDGATVVYKIF